VDCSVNGLESCPPDPHTGARFTPTDVLNRECVPAELAWWVADDVGVRR
jgi:hypothetical protein